MNFAVFESKGTDMAHPLALVRFMEKKNALNVGMKCAFNLFLPTQ